MFPNNPNNVYKMLQFDTFCLNTSIIWDKWDKSGTSKMGGLVPGLAQQRRGFRPFWDKWDNTFTIFTHIEKEKIFI